MRSELSAQQLATLRLLADGLSDHEIAAALFIARTTAQRHVSDVRVKLDARNRTHAVALGYRAGLLP